MNILLVGSGGREHALAWKIRQSPLVKRLVIAPGNAGMARLGECVPVKPTAVDDLVLLAKETRADLVVVGPEASLEVGLADRLALTGDIIAVAVLLLVGGWYGRRKEARKVAARSKMVSA